MNFEDDDPLDQTYDLDGRVYSVRAFTLGDMEWAEQNCKRPVDWVMWILRGPDGEPPTESEALKLTFADFKRLIRALDALA